MDPDWLPRRDGLVSRVRVAVTGFALTALLVCLAAHSAAAADDKPITYEDHVAGILKKHCATCHGDGK